MSLKSPEQVIRNALVNDGQVAALVGNRVYPVLAPSTATLPFVVWRRAAVRRSQSLAGPTGTPTVSLDLELYAGTYEGVRDLANKCRLVLDGYGGTLNNVEVSNTSLDNEFDGFVALQGGEVPPVYSVTQSYSVLWQET